MKIVSRKTEYIILGIILLLGLILRLYNYANFSLSNDELSAIYRCNFSNFHDLFQQGVGVDYHPAGVQVFLYYWIKVFGNSVATVRLPFVIAGTLAILFTYLFSRRWFGGTTSLLSAIAIALMPFTVIFSQIARPYASGLMLSMLLVWLWSIVLFPKKEEKKFIWGYAVLLGFVFALNLYNHYFSGLLAFIIALSGFLFLNKNNYRNYFAALVLSLVLFLPHIPMTLHHLSKGGLSSWLGAPAWDWPLRHIEIIFQNWFRLIVLTIIIGGFHLYGKKQEGLFKIRSLLLLFFSAPIFIGFFYSIFVNPVLQNSILIFSLPFLIIWIFSFISDELPAKWKYILMIIVALLFYGGIPSKSSHPMIDIQDFKGMAKQMELWENRFEKENILRIMESNSIEYIGYYLPDSNTTSRFALSNIRTEDDLLKLKNILDTGQSKILEYVILASDNPIAMNMIKNKFNYLLDSKYFAQNCRAFLFTNEFDDNLYDVKDIQYKHQIIFKENKGDSLTELKGKSYSDGLDYTFNNNKDRQIQRVEILIKTLSNKVPKQIQMVFQLDNENGSKLYWASLPFRYFVYADSAQQIYMSQELPPITEETKRLKVYIWNPGNEQMQYKDLRIYLTKDNVEYNVNEKYF